MAGTEGSRTSALNRAPGQPGGWRQQPEWAAGKTPSVRENGIEMALASHLSPRKIERKQTLATCSKDEKSRSHDNATPNQLSQTNSCVAPCYGNVMAMSSILLPMSTQTGQGKNNLLRTHAHTPRHDGKQQCHSFRDQIPAFAPRGVSEFRLGVTSGRRRQVVPVMMPAELRRSKCASFLHALE